MAPENTLPAYQWALDQGCAVLETDVRLSRDNCLFMFHDETLNRTTDGHGRVADASSATLKNLNAAYRFCTPGEHIARAWQTSCLTLEELFASFPSTRINIDIKDNVDLAANEVIRLIDQFDRSGLTTVGSFYTDVILHLRREAPHIRTAALKEEVAKLYFGRFAGRFGPAGARKNASGNLDKQVHASDSARRVWEKRERDKTTDSFEALQIPMHWHGLRLATPAFIRFGQSLGYEMVFWTVNDTKTLERLLAMGVDGVVTDRTDIAASVFSRCQE